MSDKEGNIIILDGNAYTFIYNYIIVPPPTTMSPS